MKTFPMFLHVKDRRIVIVGGGEQAAQKARLALKTEAAIVLAAPVLDAELAGLVREGRARHEPEPCAATFADTALVFVATGCKGADAAWHGIAKSAGALVNVVDYPALCDAMTPSIVDRDPVVVAIGTEGTAPVLGRRLKTRIEELLHPRLGAFAALAGRLRPEVAHRIPARARRGFWHWVFAGAPWAAFSTGREREGARLVKSAIDAGGEGRITEGRLSVVEVPANTPDLMPLRAVQRLQEADCIFIDADVDPAHLELARRDAARVQVGVARASADSPGLAALHPAPPVPRMLAAAAEGESVVYLTRRLPPGYVVPVQDGVAVEHVPGIAAVEGRENLPGALP